MVMNLSSRITSIPESAIRAAFSSAQKSGDTINLSIGEPDFDTPEHIKAAAKKALDEGYTHYAPNAGIPDLLDSIGTKLKLENGVDVEPNEQVIVTIGGTQAIQLALTVLLQEGEEVLIPSPAFVAYQASTRISGGVPIEVNLAEDYSLDVEEIKSRITNKTKVLVINTPSNPTGAITARKELTKIAELAKDKGFYILSDEVYEKFIYEGEHTSIGSLPDMGEFVITINSLSKAYGMTGWRLGYAAGPSEVINQMIKAQMYSCACVPTFIQKAAITALQSPEIMFDSIREEFKKRRDVVIRELSDTPNLSIIKPKGAFYLLPKINNLGVTSADFAKELLQMAKVAIVPGSAFGNLGENHIRISYGSTIEKVSEGARRISEHLKSMRRSR